MLADRLLQQGQRVGGLDRPVGMDAMALASAFAYQVEGPQPASPLGVVRDEAPGPDAVAAKRLPRKARAEPLPPPARAARRNLQPLLPADALDQPLVRAVAKRPQLCRDLLASKRRLLPRKADDLRLQQALPLGLGLRKVAERRAADPQLPARGSPGTRQRGLDLRRNPAEALSLLQIHASVLALPTVEALRADAAPAADPLGPKPRAGLPQYADYLLGRASCLFHR